MVRSVVLVHPYLFALLLAVVELTVGLLALIGLASRVAAAGGLALSLLFFLTASWRYCSPTRATYPALTAGCCNAHGPKPRRNQTLRPMRPGGPSLPVWLRRAGSR